MSKLTKAVFEGNFTLDAKGYYSIDLNTRNLIGIRDLELKQYCKVEKISELILEQNCIPKIEELFRNMTSLKMLEFALNQITVIENLDLPMLEQLNLSSNFIKEVPQLYMPRLKQLNLSFNSINFVADLNLPSLEQLNLAGNQLTYLPKLNQCPRLRVLDLQKNNLISLTRLIGACQYLQNLKAAYNQIPGEYIDELCTVVQSLPNLDNVDFKGNPVCQVGAYEIRLLRAKPGLKYIDNIHLTENIIQNLRNMDKAKTYNDLVEITKDQYQKWNQEREEVRRVLQKELNLQKLKLDFQFEDKEEDNIVEMKEFFEFIKALEAKKKRGEKIDMDEQTLNMWKQKLQNNENQRIQVHHQNRLQNQKNEEQRVNNYLSTKTANQKLYDIAINEPDMWRELKRKELVQIPQEQSDEPSSEMRSMNSIGTPQESGSRSGGQSVRSGRSRYQDH